MKKLFSLALVVALVIAMAITASATVTSNGGTQAGEVNATYTEGAAAPDTYAVDVVFGSMAFTFTRAAKSWDADNHVEVDDGVGAWSYDAGANEIDVTNHSNVAITATAAYAAKEGYTAVRGTFANNNLALAAAAGDSVDADTIALTLAGDLPADTDGAIADITVTIAKQAE